MKARVPPDRGLFLCCFARLTAINPSRLPLIDALKAVAAQLIVLHHLAFYGPMSDATHLWWPDLVAWFSQEARLVVQVFLVMAGYLAARSLAPDGVLRSESPGRLLWQRYLRVALPAVFALWVAMVCTELARLGMTHDSLPNPPTVGQFISHVLLLQSVLDVEALSAGVWYVAIDVQLFALLLGLLWVARQGPQRSASGRRRLARALVLLTVGASLLHFNRDPAWDDWGLYFFGAYGLGVLCAWQGKSSRDGGSLAWLLACALALVALAVDFRERMALALATACLLAWAQREGWLSRWPQHPALAYLGRISYSVFLLNFPVSLLVNALFTRFAPPDPLWQTGGVLLAWLACNLAGALFFHQVEQRIGRWSAQPRRTHWQAAGA